jgi:hypothetical protein
VMPSVIFAAAGLRYIKVTAGQFDLDFDCAEVSPPLGTTLSRIDAPQHRYDWGRFRFEEARRTVCAQWAG